MTASTTPHKRGTIDPLTAYNAFTKYGSYAETGRQLNLTRERIRQLLKLGVEQELFTFQPLQQRNHNMLPKLRTLSPSKIAAQYPEACSVKSLSTTLKVSYHTLVRHLPKTRIRALTRYYAKRYKQTIRDQIYKDYLRLHTRLGHHPSDTEMQQHTSSLSHRIRRQWTSIRNFRRHYGIRRPTSQITLRATKARADEYQRLTMLFQRGPQPATTFTRALSRETLKRLLDEQRIYAVRNGRRLMYYPQQHQRNALSA